MRKLPMLLSGVFLAIQLSRVADFVSQGLNAGSFLGWAFALGIGAGVFISAYWTRQSVTLQDGKIDKRDRQVRSAAWWSMILFVIFDGTFNLAETLRVLANQSLYWYAVLFGVSPTLIAAFLGSLQGRVDRLPVAPRKNRTGSILDAIARWLERNIAAATPQETAPQVAQVAESIPRKAPQVARKPLSDTDLLAFLQATPGASQQQVADHFGVSRQAIGQRVKKLYEVKQ